jgi:hypothetical protein
MTTLPYLDLDALTDVAGKVRLYGDEHDVLQVSGSSFRKLRELQLSRTEGKAPDLTLLYEVVGQCVPTVPAEKLNDLSPQKLGAVLALAAGNVEQVEEFAKAIREAIEKRNQPQTTEGGVPIIQGNGEAAGREG